MVCFQHFAWKGFQICKFKTKLQNQNCYKYMSIKFHHSFVKVHHINSIYLSIYSTRQKRQSLSETVNKTWFIKKVQHLSLLKVLILWVDLHVLTPIRCLALALPNYIMRCKCRNEKLLCFNSCYTCIFCNSTTIYYREFSLWSCREICCWIGQRTVKLDYITKKQSQSINKRTKFFYSLTCPRPYEPKTTIKSVLKTRKPLYSIIWITYPVQLYDTGLLLRILAGSYTSEQNRLNTPPSYRQPTSAKDHLSLVEFINDNITWIMKTQGFH